jgi:hypothetical protein
MPRNSAVRRVLFPLFLGVTIALAVSRSRQAHSEAADGNPGSLSPVIASCVHRGNVYAVTGRRDGAALFYFLQRRKLTVVPPDRAEELRIGFWQYEAQFHISNDTFFGTGGFLHHRVGLNATRLSNLDSKSKGEFPWREWTPLSLDPMQRLAIRNAKRMGFNPDFSPTKDASFAFTIGQGSKLFVFLAWKRRLSLWSGKLPTVSPKFERTQPPPIRWDNWVEEKETAPDPKPFREVETQIREPFFAYQNKTHYLFVTESGQVHCLLRQDKEKKTECVWKDAKRPVRLLLEDNATGTTWAFAPRKDARDKERTDVYFPLGKKITPIAYDAAQLPKWDTGRPLEMALAHARFLVKQKKIDPAEKKPAPAPKK